MSSTPAAAPESTRWRVSPADLVDVFVYVVVLNLAAEYFPKVVTETFTLSLLTAVLLKMVLEVVVWAKDRVKARFKAATTLPAKIVAGLPLRGGLLGSKCVRPEHLGPALSMRLEALGARLEEGLTRAVKDSGKEACVQRVGSMITLFFCQGPVRSWTDADKADRKRFAAFHGELLRRGIYWPPAQFEAAFLSGAHTDEDIDRTVMAAAEALKAA